ncbi:hypothetical protein ACFQ1L_05315 [Phytohabitans flavus]|uniref:hypothetical protein n=1 Tax=Phytohabitans flavus TaxID=1076124 RepID=UPI0036292CC8
MKSGPTYRRQGRWIVPVTPVDWQYWRSSTVPIIGVVYDPAEDVIRWCNLSRLARARVIAGDESFDPGLQSDHQTEVSVTAVLDDDSFSAFIDYAARYLDATADAAYLLLVDPEDAISGAEASGTAGRSVGTTPAADPPAPRVALDGRAGASRCPQRACARRVASRHPPDPPELDLAACRGGGEAVLPVVRGRGPDDR